MAYKKYREIGGSKHHFKWADCKPYKKDEKTGEVSGFVLIARYLSSFEGKYGTNWELETPNGEKWVMNKAGSLQYKMDLVKPGELLEIRYLGVDKMPSGKFAGKDFHDIQVLLIDENGESENVDTATTSNDDDDIF